MRRTSAFVIVALMFVACIPIMSTSAQPSGVTNQILRPNAMGYDDSGSWPITPGWSYPGSSGWVNITPAGDEYFQGTWADEGRGSLTYLASGDAYQAAWRVPTTSVPAGATLSEVHIVFYEYNAGGGLGDYDFAFYTVLAGTAVLNNIGDAINSPNSYAQGTFLGYFEDGNNIAQWHNYSLPTTALQSQMTSYSSLYFACTNTTEAGIWTGIASLEHATTTWRPYVWVKYTSPTHYAVISETTAGGDGDTSYVETTTDGWPNGLETYNVTDITGLGCSGAVKAITSVDIWVIARKTAAPAVSFEYGIEVPTLGLQHYYYSETAVALTQSYVNYSGAAWTTNPLTSSAWTLADIQGLGAYIYGFDANPSIRVTQVGIIVTINWGWSSTFTSTPPTAPHSGYWYPSDAYSYTITTNSSATLVNDLKASWQTWTSGNSTLWGRIPLTTTTQTVFVVTHATSTNGKQCSWQNYSFNIVNTAPTFTSSPVLSVNAVTNYYYDANAIDENGITYTIDTNWTGSASALTIGSTTGIVEATAPHTIGWYWVDVIADDGLYQTYQSFSVNITYVTSFYTSTPIETIHWNTNYHYDVEVTSSYTCTFDFETNWTGATISSDTGEVNRTAPHVVGWYYVHVNFTDGYAVYWQNYSVNVTNTIPSFTSTPVTTVITLYDYSYDADATQVPADGDTLTYGLETNFSGASIVPGTGVVSKTATHTLGWYYVNVNVTDGYIIVWQNFTVTVGAPWAPTFTSSPVTLVYANSSYVYVVTWNETVSSHSMTSNATWLTWYPATHSVIGGSPPDGTYWVNITATSLLGGLSSYQNYTIIITGPAPPSVAGGLNIPGTPVLALALGFFLIFWGLSRRDEYHWYALAGFVWIFNALVVFLDYGAGWMVFGLAIGLTLLAETGLTYGRGGGEKE